jgi:hypothetical protein
MQLRFTLYRAVDTSVSHFSCQVAEVVGSNDEDLTHDFLQFCRENKLRLFSESEVDAAALAYGRVRFP